jgi:extradiol dioxygenase family protein
MLTPKSIDHLVFRIADLAATERFYTAILGDPPTKPKTVSCT